MKPNKKTPAMAAPPIPKRHNPIIWATALLVALAGFSILYAEPAPIQKKKQQKQHPPTTLEVTQTDGIEYLVLHHQGVTWVAPHRRRSVNQNWSDLNGEHIANEEGWKLSEIAQKLLRQQTNRKVAQRVRVIDNNQDLGCSKQ